jgi:TRAP-type C4-dicarboxylate transport system substrate-binding protein
MGVRRSTVYTCAFRTIALALAALVLTLACQPAGQQPAQKPAEPAKEVAKPAAEKPAAPAQKPADTAAQKPGAATLGPGPKLTIQWIGHPTPTLPQRTVVEAPFVNETIPQRSNGRIDIKSATWAERNLTGNEIIRLTRQGQVDVGGAPLTYLAGDVPLLDAADLPGLNPTIDQARKVMDALEPTINQELERFGVMQIAHYPYPSQVFWCKPEIKGVDDLKGKRIRTFGTSLPDLVVALGGQNVSITFAEVYTSLERGVVECGITGTASGNSAKWFEVTNYLYTLNVGWSLGAYYVNLKWWNGLDPQVRDFMKAQFDELEDRLWKLGAELDQDGINCSIGKQPCKYGTLDAQSPMTLVEPKKEDVARVQRILEDTVIPNWVKRCGERCGEIFNQQIAPIANVKYVKK